MMQTAEIYSGGAEKKQVESKVYGVYLKSVLTQKIVLSINEVGKNLKQNLEKKIAASIEGKCIAQGFVKPGSVSVVNFSSGNVNAANVEFQVVFECMICHPVEGMLIECKAKTITKAGIHAEVVDASGVIPVTVFVARDHNYNDIHFNNVKENAEILVRVLGTRFELNDPYICVIAKLAQLSKRSDAPAQPLKKGGFSEAAQPRISIFNEDANIGYSLGENSDDDEDE
jgi:DNA-directed RNA polymerase subunit E'/Rpb7